MRAHTPIAGGSSSGSDIRSPGPSSSTGAEPGDVLEVELLGYETPELGVNGVIPGFGFLADLFTEPFLVKWELDGDHARSEELPGVAVHACVACRRDRGGAVARADGDAAGARGTDSCRRRPRRGRLPGDGAAPAAASGLRTIPPRETGGNIDIRRLVAGATLLLPVHVPGALLSLGDVHFAQGDGEVCGTGIEIAAAVTVRLGLRKAPRWAPRFPAYLTPPEPARARFATTGISEDAAMDLTAAARAALLAMIDWLEVEHGLSRSAAYCLCSACVDLQLSEIVDIPFPLVSASIPLDVFDA